MFITLPPQADRLFLEFEHMICKSQGNIPYPCTAATQEQQHYTYIGKENGQKKKFEISHYTLFPFFMQQLES